jgi:ribonuclease P protein component
VYVTHADSHEQARFGFIVSKSVGVAVKRNLVRRRLKAVSYESLANVGAGTDVVIRALPGAAQASWATLRSEISEVLNGGVTRA